MSQSQIVFSGGHRIEVPGRVFSWLVEFSREVSAVVSEITGVCDDRDRERLVLEGLVKRLAMMAPGPDGYGLDTSDPDTSDPVLVWLHEHHEDYTRLVYDLVDVRVDYGPNWIVSLREVLARVVRKDVDPVNWDAVRLSYKEIHPSCTEDEACSHANAFGHLVRREYGRALLNHFLSHPSGGLSPQWCSTEGSVMGDAG